MSANSNLNGSVDLLANAMRKVFGEAVEGAVNPLTTEVKALRTEVVALRTEVNDKIDTTNENMQAQFAEQQKKIGKLMSEFGGSS